MATNMALKRAAKANRRKAVVAEKRKLELLNDSLTARVLRAAHAPIQHCLVPETLFGDVRADASDATFQFGREEKVLYLPGPRESPTQVRLRFQRLGRALGIEKLEFGQSHEGQGVES